MAAKPFTIGLSPLGAHPWLIVDDRLPGYLAEKRRLMDAAPHRVLAAEADTADAQAETLDRIVSWTLKNHPDRFRRDGDRIRVAGSPEPVRLDSDAPAIGTAGRLCAEDLVLMRKGENGWRLAAASLCFPSSWRLADKFTRPMDAIHAPVPGFSSGTRNAMLVNRILDNLPADEPVLRGNWSVYRDDLLHHPEPHSGEAADGSSADAAGACLREERQTLTRLPGSGDILFTILISITPLGDLARTEGGRSRAATLASHVAAMSADELAYKSMTGRRGHLIALLNEIAAGKLYYDKEV